MDIFNSFGGFTDPDGQGGQTNGAATETFTQARKDGSIHFVKTEVVDAENRQAFTGNISGDGGTTARRCPHLSEITDPAQQTVGDTGCAPGTPGNLRKIGRAHV